MRQNIYDNEEFAEEYNRMRKVEKKGTSANDLIEIPTLRGMLPDLKGLRVLDLGCGYGENCKYFIENGASYVLGIDISTKMIKIANEENKLENIDYKVMAMEDLKDLNEKFDLVVSSLAIHYVKDFDKLCKDVSDLLNENGYFIFSQEHPIGTGTRLNEATNWKVKVDLGGKRYYLVSDYNRCGEIIVKWSNFDVIMYHRNFSLIINTLIKYFNIKELNEPTPSQEIIDIVPKYIYQFDMPYFLFIKTEKK